MAGIQMFVAFFRQTDKLLGRFFVSFVLDIQNIFFLHKEVKQYQQSNCSIFKQAGILSHCVCVSC